MSDENQEPPPERPESEDEPAYGGAPPRDPSRSESEPAPPREGGPPADAEPAPHAPPGEPEPPLAEALRRFEYEMYSEKPPTWREVVRELSPPGFFPWLAIVFVLGLTALLLGQTDTALLIGVTGLFVTAQGADTHEDWHLVHLLVSWIPSATGVTFLASLMVILSRSDFPLPVRIVTVAIAGGGALLCLLAWIPAVGDLLTRLFFRDGPPNHTRKLTARLVLFSLLLAPSAWFAVRGLLATALEQPNLLVTTSGLSGSLVGYTVLAFGSIGWIIRRSWREALERLGLRGLRPMDALVIPLGVAALWIFNTGSEWVQRTTFPALWAGDQHFTEVLAHSMGAGQMLLLGLSAGVGEEITMRGALQPRLGIVLTSLVFASLHVQYSWYGIASIFVFGMILGLIRQRSSTTAAIVVHALYDMLALATAK